MTLAFRPTLDVKTFLPYLQYWKSTLQDYSGYNPLIGGEFSSRYAMTSYFSRRWLHAEANFSRSAGGRGGGGAVLLSLALAHSRLTLYAHTPHARTLVMHLSRARTLLISCPPEAAAGGSTSLIDRPIPTP